MGEVASWRDLLDERGVIDGDVFALMSAAVLPGHDPLPDWVLGYKAAQLQATIYAPNAPYWVDGRRSEKVDAILNG